MEEVKTGKTENLDEKEGRPMHIMGQYPFEYPSRFQPIEDQPQSLLEHKILNAKEDWPPNDYPINMWPRLFKALRYLFLKKFEKNDLVELGPSLKVEDQFLDIAAVSPVQVGEDGVEIDLTALAELLELANFVTLADAQTISGQKTFLDVIRIGLTGEIGEILFSSEDSVLASIKASQDKLSLNIGLSSALWAEKTEEGPVSYTNTPEGAKGAEIANAGWVLSNINQSLEPYITTASVEAVLELISANLQEVRETAEEAKTVSQDAEGRAESAQTSADGALQKATELQDTLTVCCATAQEALQLASDNQELASSAQSTANTSFEKALVASTNAEEAKAIAAAAAIKAQENSLKLDTIELNPTPLDSSQKIPSTAWVQSLVSRNFHHFPKISNIYVDQLTGSDVLESTERGLSADAPLASIQAAVDYVSRIPSYLLPDSISNRHYVKIHVRGGTGSDHLYYGDLDIANLGLDLRLDVLAYENTNVTINAIRVFCSNVIARNMRVARTDSTTGALISADHSFVDFQNLDLVTTAAIPGIHIYRQASAYLGDLNFYGPFTDVAYLYYMAYASFSGNLGFNNNQTERVITAHLNSTAVLYNTFTGTATGKRYKISGNSICNVNGRGPDCIPGDVAGEATLGALYY